MKTVNPQNIATLRQIIESHLQSFGIQSHIQEALSEKTGIAEGTAGECKAPNDIIGLLRKKGVIQDFIKSLREQTAIESLVLSSADPESGEDGSGCWTNDCSPRQPSSNQNGDVQAPDISSEEFAKTERWLQQQESFEMDSFFSGWNEHGTKLLSSDTGPKPVDLLSVQIPKISTAGMRNPKVHPSMKLENPRNLISRGVQRSSKLADIEAGLRPDKTYLLLRLHGGREFLKRHSDVAEDHLLVSVNFLGQRFTSKSLTSGTEPMFSDTLVLGLSKGPTTSVGYRKTEEDLLHVMQPIHIVVVRVKQSDEKALIGTATVEWRRSLFFGVESLSVELLGIGSRSSVVTGILDLDIELRASSSQLPISQALVAAQLQQEQTQNSANISSFIAYAKTWWKEFLRMRESHRKPRSDSHSTTDSQRLVKVLALNESRQARPVCSYVQPLQAGRLLGSSAEAARFVSLLKHEEEKVQGCETWTNMHTFLTRGSGDQEDHAVLLCNLLLGFGLDAFVCIGRDSQGARLWVMTRASGGDMIFWESLTGQRYAFKTWAANANLPVPYQTLSCVFNHQRFYANIQSSDTVRNCFLDLENEQHWKCMQADKMSPIPKAPGVVFRPPSINAFAQEEKLEGILRAMITDYRQKLRMPSSWSKKLSRLLMPALVAYEQEAIFGGPLRHEEFQQGITRAIPKRHVFKGIPLHFNHRSPKMLIAQLCGDSEFQHLLELRGPLVNFAVRVKITVYPEDVCSCWVMVAVEYPCVS